VDRRAQLELKGTIVSPWRKGAAICAVKDVVYVFGGVARDDDDKEFYLDDMVVLKTEGNTMTAGAYTRPFCSST
jgi:hypothetical protein